jgi:hypothetical protein
VKWLRSYISRNPFPFAVFGFGVLTLAYAPPEWSAGRLEFNRVVSLAIMAIVVGFLVWRWVRDQPRGH